MNSKVSVIHATAGLNPSSGGTTRVVIDLTDALVENEIDITLLTQSPSGSDVMLSASDKVHRVIAESSSQYALQFGLPFHSALHGIRARIGTSLVHSHGVWLPVNHWTARYAHWQKLPLVLQPHGMLEPWAMHYKAWKKRLIMALYQWRDLRTATVLIATAANEYENLRALGLPQPIAIIPNGVHVPVGNNQPGLREYNPKQPRRALFLSRVQEKKGLLNLIDAWALVRADGWRLQIAGPDEDGHLAEVLARAQKAGVGDSVEYVGVVDGDAKSQLYNAADLFVLPTFSENFGVVVAEALAHGLPVITTKGAPWEDLNTHKCGWWIDIGVVPLAIALREAIALSDVERQAMGLRGREYVRRFDWGDIAQQTADVYRWVLGQGPKPQCVHFD